MPKGRRKAFYEAHILGGPDSTQAVSHAIPTAEIGSQNAANTTQLPSLLRARAHEVPSAGLGADGRPCRSVTGGPDRVWQTSLFAADRARHTEGSGGNTRPPR